MCLYEFFLYFGSSKGNIQEYSENFKLTSYIEMEQVGIYAGDVSSVRDRLLNLSRVLEEY